MRFGRALRRLAFTTLAVPVAAALFVKALGALEVLRTDLAFRILAVGLAQVTLSDYWSARIV